MRAFRLTIPERDGRDVGRGPTSHWRRKERFAALACVPRSMRQSRMCPRLASPSEAPTFRRVAAQTRDTHETVVGAATTLRGRHVCRSSQRSGTVN